MKNFISVEQLKENLKDAVILDIRFDLHDPAYGKKAYNEGHIKGSFFIDLNKKLAGEKKKHGGSRPLPEIDKVKEAIEDEDISLVESRSYERYLGKNKPFYSKPGHIPTALSIDSKSLLREDKKVKPVEELKEIFKRLEVYKDVIFSYGSAVNAALDYAIYDEFFSNGKVYIGSYSDWISYPENPIEIKDKN